jgi:hypothetical protein
MNLDPPAISTDVAPWWWLPLGLAMYFGPKVVRDWARLARGLLSPGGAELDRPKEPMRMPPDYLQRLVLLALLDGPEPRTLPSLARELSQPVEAVRTAVAALEHDGLAKATSRGVRASRAAFRMDALELVVI